jgi:parvulin-like peptidyl-prolyl isomerase
LSAFVLSDQSKATHVKKNLFCFFLMPIAMGASPLLANGETVVSWKSGTITTLELESDLIRFPQEQREKTIKNPQMMSQLMDNIHLYKILAERAEKSGYANQQIVKSSAEIARVRSIGGNYLQSLQEAEKKRLGDLTPAAREKYLKDPTKYRLTESVSAAHVLIGVKDRSEIQAKELAEKIRQQLLKGESIEELAAKHSDDVGSKNRGGALGMFGRGAMVKEFEEAAFALTKDGELSPVVKTPFGYHVIRLTSKQAAKQQSFDEVKDVLISEITQESLERFRDAYIAEIRSDSSIRVNDSAFEAMTGVKRMK